ncbi:MAG: IspD/TarI family cytidylyltransferase [Candidatus Calescibacterium sp.]|nr:2-C-methyl-D-erythritol 4-phosphate cytidylyltransferase [Candidatus Calescibacterium sp.]MDW8132336.1 IspD/TarI family cytidylyltransferase [Candidatus Calescibacterium sp.]
MIGLVLLAAGNSERFIQSINEFINQELINKDSESLSIDKTNQINELVDLINRGTQINKVFLKIGNLMVWEYSINVFSKFNKQISNIIFVLNRSTFEIHKEIISEKIQKYNFNNVEFAEGGNKRQDSVFNGIKLLENKYIDHIIIHDLARPLITENDIKKLIETIKDYDGLTLYSQPNDSVVANYDNKITYLPRNLIYLIKTPQIFKKNVILSCHEELRKENLELEFTDDISLLDFYLFKTGFVPGNPMNIKITTIHDYILLTQIINTNYFSFF